MKRKTWVLAGAAVLAAVTTTGVVIATPGAKHATLAAAQPPPNTATVEKRELSAMVSVNGTLTYQARSDGSPYSAINQASGTYTELPAAGQVISQGQALYRVNDSPVVLLYGSTPAYRTLSAGATGADVAELNADLVALGYATSAQLSPTSAAFGSATTTALEKLQAALGEAQNGTLTLGQAVFEPTAMRVTTVSAQLGGGAQTGQTVTQATSTTRQVQVALDASQQTDVAVGDKVTITLPNNQTTPGVVSSVGTVATCPSSSGPGGSSSDSAAPGTDTCSIGQLGEQFHTDHHRGRHPLRPGRHRHMGSGPGAGRYHHRQRAQRAGGAGDRAAGPTGGGYAVEVVGAGGTNHLVAVSLGLFDDADGLVQVTGSGLAAGQQVVVPAT